MNNAAITVPAIRFPVTSNRGRTLPLDSCSAVGPHPSEPTCFLVRFENRLYSVDRYYLTDAFVAGTGRCFKEGDTVTTGRPGTDEFDVGRVVDVYGGAMVVDWREAGAEVSEEMSDETIRLRSRPPQDLS